ncbi:hypothetical protein [Nonomuraea soli]|uniref:Uncharacterized protein n=1 Tax=Nonomuraea soli TaxID=1032476 RepID=A0A7W0HS43_9ACTN|nr:hypothetical protein [Nonomuraea soli]MBA2893276.1 hypothetical protein [Nonomuraea soli]
MTPRRAGWWGRLRAFAGSLVDGSRRSRLVIAVLVLAIAVLYAMQAWGIIPRA